MKYLNLYGVPKMVKTQKSQAARIDATLPYSAEIFRQFSDDQDRVHLTVSSFNNDGIEAVVSRYGDPEWDLSPYIPNANRNQRSKVLNWKSVPPSFVSGAKSIVYAYWSFGILGYKRPKASTVHGLFTALKPFMVWLTSLGITNFRYVTSLHCSAYVQSCVEQGLSAVSKCHRFSAIEIAYKLRDHSNDPLSVRPWPGSSAKSLSGLAGKRGPHKSTTDIIPKAILETLFAHAERTLDAADQILLKVEDGNDRFQHRNKDMIRLRNACYFILAITTGCRNHELASIEVGAAMTTSQDGNTFYWLVGDSLKTNHGKTRWMMPEIGFRAVTVMERWSTLYRTRIREDLNNLDAELGAMPPRGRPVEKVKLHAQLRSDVNRLFLGHSPMQDKVTTLSGRGWARQLQLFAVECELDWPLASHQLRRTFATLAAHHALGDLRYLKHHFKHWSIDMTALYALNEEQEEELYDEVLASIRERKIGILQNILDADTLLAGRTAGHIGKYRRKIELTKMDRQALIEDTSEKVNIRSTGHSWCLSTSASCGGRGLYEKTYCAGSGCRNAVIPDSFKPVYQGLLQQMIELGVYAEDLGPGGRRRIARDIQICKDVLKDFGVVSE